MRTTSRMTLGWLAAMMGVLLAGGVQADTYVWTQTNRGAFSWSDTANWSNNAAPPSGGASNAVIQLFTNLTPFGAGFLQTNDNDLGVFQLNAFSFNSRNANATNVLQGGALKFMADGPTAPKVTIDANGGNGRSITIMNDLVLDRAPLSMYLPQGQNSAYLNFRGNMSGTGNVVLATGGLYTYLSGVKTFTGDIIVSNKHWYLAGTNAFVGNLVVRNGGSVYLYGPGSANDFTGVAVIDPGGTVTFTPATQSGVWNNQVTNNGSLVYYWSGAGGSAWFNGLISGSGTLAMNPASGGTLYLTNTLNTYSGKTDIQQQTLVINTIGDVNGGSSSIGNPDTVSNGTINLGISSAVGTLKYVGGAATSDRVINLAGTTGGGTLDASGTGALVLTATNMTVTGAGSKTLTLQGSNADANTLAGVIPNNSAANKTAVTKTGTGTWVLQGTNTYTGLTTVNGGILVLLGNHASATGNTLVTSGTLRIGSTANLGPGNLSMNGGVLESAGDVAFPGGVASGQMQIPGGASGLSARGGNIQAAFGTLGAPESLTWGSATFNPSPFILNGTMADGALVFRSPINLNSAATAKTNTVQVNAASAELAGVLTQSGAGYTLLSKTGNGTLILATNHLGAAAGLALSAGALQVAESNSLPAGLLTLAGGTLLDLRNDAGTVFRDASGPHAVAFSGTGSYTVNVDRGVGGSGMNQTHELGTLATIPGGGILAVTGGNGYGLRVGSLAFSSISSAISAGSVLNNAPGLLTVTGGITTAQSSSHGWLTLGGSGDMEIMGSILGAMGAPTTGLTKNDSNLVILSGSNRFGAAGNSITVNGGTLRVNHPYGLPNFSGVVSNALKMTGGTLDFNGYSFTVNGASFGSLGTASAATATLATATGTVTLIGNILFTNNAAGDNGSLISGNLSLNNAARTFTVHDAVSTPYDMTVSADIAGGGAGGALTKAGLGTLRLSGSNSFTGATLINAGALVLDYTANPGPKLASGASVTLGSSGFPGSLVLLGTPSGGAVSFGGLIVSGISNSLALPAATVLNVGTMNISLGATPVVLSVPAGSALQTSAGGTPGGILTNSGGIVVGTYNGNDDWAARDADGVTLTGLSAVGGYTAMGSYVSGCNADITGDVTPPASATFNSLRFNTAAPCTLLLSGVNTLPTGGILVTPAVGANRTTITGGLLRPNSNTGGREFAILQNNPDGDLLLGTVLTNNSGSAYVVKSGPGRLVMTAHNVVGGSTYLNAGELQYGDGSTTGTLTQAGWLYAQNGTVIRVAGTNLVVSTVTGFYPFGNPVIDVAADCVLQNGTMNSGGNGGWIKTGPGTLRQLGQGFTPGWVKEGVFLADAGANYTINGGVTIGATNVDAPPALVKIMANKEAQVGGVALINRTGTFDLNGFTQGLGTVTFTGGGLVTNSSGSAKAKNQVFNYNVAPGVGETAVWAADLEGSWNRNDNVAMQFTINDDPDLDVEAVVSGNISNYPGYPGWAIQKLGVGTLYFTGTNTWTGTNTVAAGMLKAKRPASLPGYNGNNRWPVSAGATLAVCAGGAGEWTAADIDALRGTTPSPFAAASFLGIDTAGGDFTYDSLIGGALGLRKLGTNSLVLTAANTFSGGTVIQGGTLVASNANALGTSGTVTVNSNAMLGVASGVAFSRAVTFNAGSGLTGNGTFVKGGAWTPPASFTLAPGLPAGTLTVDGALTLSAANTLSIAFQPDGSYGKLLVNGVLDISEPTARLVLTGKAPTGKTVLAEGASRVGTFQEANVDMTGLTGSGSISYTATQVILNVAAKGTIIWVR